MASVCTVAGCGFVWSSASPLGKDISTPHDKASGILQVLLGGTVVVQGDCREHYLGTWVGTRWRV
jgi:hypothetical protein